MFRRRRARAGRALRRMLRGGPLLRPAGRAAMIRIRHAHMAFAHGDFESAARDMEWLAEEAEDQGHPRAAVLHLQSGASWFRAGMPEPARVQIEAGFRLLSGDYAGERAVLLASRLARDLETWGLPDAAAYVRGLAYVPSGAHALSSPRESGPQGRLPTHCPQCGGSVHPGEVEWADDRTAICDYCGSPIQASG
ncbi:MAG: hypothetical protein WD906_04890 [Anaerolineales bacterium]